jgi:uncharacterized protein YjiS (DUF1127 family)
MATVSRHGAWAGRKTAGLRRWLGHLLAGATRWQDRARQRRTLAELPEPLLRDVGLTREDVQAELRKPFWRA